MHDTKRMAQVFVELADTLGRLGHDEARVRRVVVVLPLDSRRRPHVRDVAAAAARLLGFLGKKLLGESCVSVILVSRSCLACAAPKCTSEAKTSSRAAESSICRVTALNWARAAKPSPLPYS